MFSDFCFWERVTIAQDLSKISATSRQNISCPASRKYFQSVLFIFNQFSTKIASNNQNYPILPGIGQAPTDKNTRLFMQFEKKQCLLSQALWRTPSSLKGRIYQKNCL